MPRARRTGTSRARTPAETDPAPASKPRRRPRRQAPEAATVPVRIAGAGSEGVIHHQRIEHRPTSRYLMKELFD